MAADYGKITENLQNFYDFTDKVVLFVGAGARLFDAFVRAKRLIAIDKDAEALRELETSIALKGFQGSVEIIASSFEEVTRRGDVVYFEFCLHEMINPLEALNHARTLAGDILVYDHLPGSDWIFYGAEEDKVRRSAEEMERFGVRRRQTFTTEQRFRDYSELLAKLSGQGPTAIQRAQRFVGHADIAIPMTYQLALL